MILLDTNAACWLHAGHRRARPLLKLPRLHLSPAVLLELQVLVESGRFEFEGYTTSTHFAHDPRWRLDEPPAGPWFLKAIEMSWTRDPFDRLLVAHARVRGWKLATSDEAIIGHLPPSEVFPL
jgi:PIN domain nuclease of toxin-antitoxin system